MRPIPKIEDYIFSDKSGYDHNEYYLALEQWAKEAEKIILEYEKEASIRAVIDAESLGGIQQQEGKA